MGRDLNPPPPPPPREVKPFALNENKSGGGPGLHHGHLCAV